MPEYYVYMLRMKDGRIYAGHSNNPYRRQHEHEKGKGCRTTCIFGSGEIIFIEKHPDRVSAARHERQLEKWSRAKKLALAAGDVKKLQKLSASHETSSRRTQRPGPHHQFVLTETR